MYPQYHGWSKCSHCNSKVWLVKFDLMFPKWFQYLAWSQGSETHTCCQLPSYDCNIAQSSLKPSHSHENLERIISKVDFFCNKYGMIWQCAISTTVCGECNIGKTVRLKHDLGAMTLVAMTCACNWGCVQQCTYNSVQHCTTALHSSLRIQDHDTEAERDSSDMLWIWGKRCNLLSGIYGNENSFREFYRYSVSNLFRLYDYGNTLQRDGGTVNVSENASLDWSLYVFAGEWIFIKEGNLLTDWNFIEDDKNNYILKFLVCVFILKFLPSDILDDTNEHEQNGGALQPHVTRLVIPVAEEVQDI